jgi:thiol-disulfide isomerase/thioredoxin
MIKPWISNLSIVLLIFFGLQQRAQAQEILPFHDSLALNQVVFDSLLEGECMQGWLSKEGLATSEVFSFYYQEEWKAYHADSVLLDSLCMYTDSIHIVLVLGTWCSDSQREVPRFLKIAQEIKLQEDKIKIIGVNRKKQAPIPGLESLNITFVPTFVVYKNHKEIGRIIESPMESLEKDLLKILLKNR